MFTALVLSFTMSTSEAFAQQDQNCCKYIIDVDQVPRTCFPFDICTYWANGFPPVIPPVSIVSNGVTTHGLPWACPPSSVFFGASINCQFPIAAYNNPVCYNVNGCNLVIRIGYDNGCVRIHVRPC